MTDRHERDDQLSAMASRLFNEWRDAERIAAFGCGPLRRVFVAGFLTGADVGRELAMPKRKRRDNPEHEQ